MIGRKFLAPPLARAPRSVETLYRDSLHDEERLPGSDRCPFCICMYEKQDCAGRADAAGAAAVDRARARCAERRSAVEHASSRADCRQRHIESARRHAHLRISDRRQRMRFRRWPLPEPASPKTPAARPASRPPDDLQPTTRMYWRARMVQETTNSDWSKVGKFKTRLVGYNRPGELYDPLVHGETIGTSVGNFTLRARQGHPA